MPTYTYKGLLHKCFIQQISIRYGDGEVENGNAGVGSVGAPMSGPVLSHCGDKKRFRPLRLAVAQQRPSLQPMAARRRSSGSQLFPKTQYS